MKKIIEMMRKTSIHKRLILTFSMTILIPSIIIASVNYFEYVSHIKQMSMKNLELVTNISSKLFQDELMKYEQMTLQMNKDEEIFACLNSFDEGNYESAKTTISNILYDYAKEFKYISNLQIVLEDYQFSQISYMGYEKGALIKDLDAFNKQEKMNRVAVARGYPLWFDTTHETGVYINQRNETGTISNYLTLLRSMIDPVSKQQVATIVVNVDSRFIKGAMNFQPFISNGNILFISSKGPLASLNENIKGPNIKNFPELLAKIKKAEEEANNVVYEDNNIIFFNKLPQTEYFVIQIINRNELIKDALLIRNKNLLILLICIILALSIAYMVMKSISNPIDKLALTMAGTNDNELPLMYKDSGNDEISKLGLHYNEMLTEINDLINELYITELKKNDAKLNALQRQINPHFIYNTLDFMRWEAMDLTESENNLSIMISDFSKLLRLSISKGDDFISIKQELDHIKAYLQVSNFRYNPPINLIIDNKAKEFMIPKLTLQPIIENSIVHGFQDKTKENIIKITIEEHQDIIQIKVVDNGKGISSSKLDEINERLLKDDEYDQDARSIGLNNVNQRLKLYYGIEYGIKITRSKQGGTEVIYNIPSRKE